MVENLRMLMKYILIICSFLCILDVNAQSDKYLNSKLSYCRVEVSALEDKVSKYENLLNLQTKDVQGLKVTIQEKNIEIDQLKREKQKLVDVAVNMINLALKLEKEGKYQSAMEVYKILIKSYPKSLEASASRIKVVDLTKDLAHYK
jgi:tetratricopeptide (TPR) repeat protein